MDILDSICIRCPGRDDCPAEEAEKLVRTECPAELFLAYAAPKLVAEQTGKNG